MPKPINIGRVTTCQHCGTNHPLYASGTVCFLAWLYLWERDLLYQARQEPAWRAIAQDLGFSDAKIDAPWTFPDAGRRIAWHRIARPA